MDVESREQSLYNIEEIEDGRRTARPVLSQCREKRGRQDTQGPNTGPSYFNVPVDFPLVPPLLKMTHCFVESRRSFSTSAIEDCVGPSAVDTGSGPQKYTSLTSCTYD